MSRQLILKTAAVSCAGLALGIASMAFWKATEPATLKHRRIASVDNPRGPVMGKHLSMTSVAIRPSAIPVSENDEVTLTGMVRLNQNVAGELRYRWDLPAGVHVVEGQMEDGWAGVQKGKVVEVKLVVTGFSKQELKMISLHGFVKSGDTEYGSSASITSRPEDSIEMLAESRYEKAVREASLATAVGVHAEARKPSALLKGKIIR